MYLRAAQPFEYRPTWTVTHVGIGGYGQAPGLWHRGAAAPEQRSNPSQGIGEMRGSLSSRAQRVALSKRVVLWGGK